MNTEQLAALISLLHVPLVGAYKARDLVTAFPKKTDIFTVSKTDLCRVEGIDVKTAEQIRSNHDLDLSVEERSIFTLLEHSPIHIGELVKKSELDLTILLTILLGLELKGAVLQLSGKQFVRA